MTIAARAMCLAILPLAGCAGASGSSALPASGALPLARLAPSVTHDALHPVVRPAALAFLETGAAGARTIAVRERGNTGNYEMSDGCKDVVRFARTGKKKGETNYSATPLHPGTCRVRFVDARSHGVTMTVTVTATSVQLAGSSVSPAAESVSVVSGSARAVSAVTACAQGCTIAAPPSAPGDADYGVTIYMGANGTGKILATGTVAAAIVQAKQNLVPAAPLRVPALAAFGTMPAGTSGAAFAPALVSLFIRDAGGYAIPGSFSAPVVVTDDDTSTIAQGSFLMANGIPARSISLTQSTAALAFGYGGLAIAPAHLTAAFGSVAIGQTQFAPMVPRVVYSGPRDASQLPEIDLYDKTAGQPGYTASFTLSPQPGWSLSPYGRPFTFVGTGSTNDCSSFTITAVAGSPASFTVHPVASPQPGLCTMMLTGGSSASSTPLILTYTIPTPIHVSAIGVRP
jgi:hypothetical protein